ncbi:hypothetical protein [Streptomyces sp. P9-A4]|uniref:hypothetical protein n=1 Tax=Streptomyces sp. P9-A4 TaxID=3072285 RepID=UPI002FC89178
MTAAPVDVPVTRRIGPHPQGEVVATAYCLDGGCTWETQPTPAPPGVNVECLAHAVAIGHDTFAVTVEYVALVTDGPPMRLQAVAVTAVSFVGALAMALVVSR